MNEKNEQKVISGVIQLAKTTIPAPYEPRTISNNNYVIYGVGNRFPETLIGYYRSCATHATIINTKASYIIGDGLRRKDTGESLNSLKVNASDKMPGFLQKITLDYLIHNYFTVVVQFPKFKPSQALSIDHKPARMFRWNIDKTTFWEKDDWLYGNIAERHYERVIKVSDNETDSSKVYFYDGYRPSLNKVYPDPDYIQCIEDIVVDLSIRRFNRNNIETNFSPRKKIRINTGINTPQHQQDYHVSRVEKFFTGIDGESIFYEFNSPGLPPIFEVEDVDSNSWADVYDKTRDATIKNIYEGHSINAALLGKETPGSLGNSQQLQMSYNIFKDNYIQQKRNELEEALSDLFGYEVEFIDKPLVKPTIPDATLEKILTKNELRSIAGYEARLDGDVYIQVSQPGGVNQPVTTPLNTSSDSNLATESTINDNLKNLTPKQYQNIMRIVREFNKEKLTREGAVTLLKGGYNLTDEDIDSFLGVVEEVTEEEFKKHKLTVQDFDKVKHMGISKKKYKLVEEGGEEKLRAIELRFDKESDIADYVLKNDIKELSYSEVKALIRKDLGIDLTTKELRSTLKGLNDAGVIKVTESDGNIKIEPPTKPAVPETRELTIMYEYEVKPGYGERLIPTSRDFCIKLIENDRYYTRKEIQQMSQIFGYDIFKYTGGYYHNPETGKTTSDCRHFWKEVIVTDATPDELA